MKKSRIIIPALAMIAFSVAASITGTVAWFTANRTATINAGSYAVVKTTSNLECNVDDGIGTSATDNAVGATDVIAVNGKLSDGSFDHANKHIYTPDVTGSKVARRDTLGTATASDLTRGQTAASETIYTAVTWELSFSLTFGSAGGNIGLYLDLSASSFSPSGNEAQTGQQDTSKGFRMAFVPKGTNAASANTRVFADLQAGASCTYVSNIAAQANLPNPATSYSSPVLIDNSSNAGLAESYTASDSASMPNFFGTFTFAANATVTLEFDVVCWFEGTDANIVNGDTQHTTVFRDVTATLAFAALNFA